MQVTINLDAAMIEKLEKFRGKELVRIESLTERYEGVDSEDAVERTKFLESYLERYKKYPLDAVLERYLM